MPALPAITEKQFQAQVLELARLYGWRWYHTHDSRRSPAGFPDLVLVHPRRMVVLFVELKTDRGRLRSEQFNWICDLRCAGAEAVTWRPKFWPEIERVLSGVGNG